MTRIRFLAVALGLFAGSVVLYGSTTSFGFVDWDDGAILLQHPALYDQQSLGKSLDAIVYRELPREEPLLLRDLTWAVDAYVFGFANPFGYHLGNVLWNAVNVVLAFVFLALLTGRRGESAVVAALFGVLPIHVEPVSWVMGRKDVLSTAFMLAALILHTLELRSAHAGRRRAAFWGVVLATLLAMLAKFGAVALFLVLGLQRALDPYLAGARAPGEPLAWRDAARRALPMVAAAGLVSIGVYFWYRAILVDFQILQGRGPGVATGEHVLTLAKFVPLTLGLYLVHYVWPYELSVNYPFPSVNVPVSGGVLAISALVAAGLAAGLVWVWRRRKDLAFFALAPLLLLIPYLNIVYIGTWLADRYFYFPSLFVTVLLVAVARGWTARGRPWRCTAAWAACVAVAVWFGVRTYQHQAVWRNDEALWRHEASRSYPSVLSFHQLARRHLAEARGVLPGPDRARRLALARDTLERGIARFEALGYRPSSYATNERTYAARLHALRGDVAELEGVGAVERLPHHERAYELDASAANAIGLSRAYMNAAGEGPAERRNALVVKSLGAFVRYLERVRHEPSRLDAGLRMLETNYGHMPFLARDLETLRARFAPEGGGAP